VKSIRFFVTTDDGVKVYLDHTLIIDSWHNERGNEKRATANLTAHKYHDIKIEYKEEVGLAYMQLHWTSKSIQKTLIPQDQLYYPTHISRSPFSTEVLQKFYSQIITITMLQLQENLLILLYKLKMH